MDFRRLALIFRPGIVRDRNLPGCLFPVQVVQRGLELQAAGELRLYDAGIVHLHRTELGGVNRLRGLIRAADLPAFLVDLFPESREVVARIAQEYQDTPGIAAYAYASEAFWWPVFEPALSAATDDATIKKCFDALERMLACPDRAVRDAAGIRITPYLLDPVRSDLVRRYSGPLTLTTLQRATSN